MAAPTRNVIKTAAATTAYTSGPTTYVAAPASGSGAQTAYSTQSTFQTNNAHKAPKRKKNRFIFYEELLVLLFKIKQMYLAKYKSVCVGRKKELI